MHHDKGIPIKRRREWPIGRRWPWDRLVPEPTSVVRPAARGPLRVATFNVGMMSTFVRNWDREKNVGGAITEGLVNLFITDADAVEIGRRVADRLLEAPYDIVVLQELFHSDARAALIERLRDPELPDGVRYPWIRSGFGAEERTPPNNPQPMPWDVTPDFGPFGDLGSDAIGALRSLLGDSGLMLASRLPLQRFQLEGRSTTWAFARYSASSGIDAVAPKGAAAVVVRPPFWRDVVIAFTHAQADDTNEHVRKAQFEQLVWLARGVGEAANTEDVIIMGDLNVRGEVPTEPIEKHGEYVDVFAPTGVLGQIGEDGWRDGACALGPEGDPVPGLFDPCITHPSSDQRLDYVLVGRLDGRPARSERHLAVQHLMLSTNLDEGNVSSESPIGLGPVDLPAPRGHVHLSDHVGVNAIIGMSDDHCSPRFAFDCTPPVDPSSASQERSVEFKGVQHGELRWLILEPGAYRIAVQANLGETLKPVDLEVFAPTNVSVSLANVMPPDATPIDERMGTRYPAVDHHLLVRLHSLRPDHDELSTTVRRIIGATPEDAVPLRPWTATAPMPWPTPAQGGQPDRARWFEVLLDPPDPGVDQRVMFEVREAKQPDGKEGAPLTATFDLFVGTSIATPGAALGNPTVSLAAGEQRVVAGSADGDRRFLVRATPDSALQEVEAVVEVKTDVRFLVGTGFVALDETGPDWSGADEIEWSVKSDLHESGLSIAGTENDVDSSEAFPMPTKGPLGFRDAVTVVLTEIAGAGTNEFASFTLPADRPPESQQRIEATLPDDVKNGTYGVDFTWTRVLRHV